MKKSLGVLTVGMLAVMCSLTGCNGAASPEVPTVHAEVDTDMTLHDGSTDYACHVQYVSKDNATLTLSSPESLAGMTFHRSNGAYTLSLGSLLCKGGRLLPEQGALVQRTLAVFDALPDAEMSCLGQDTDGSYTFVLPSGDAIVTDSQGQWLSVRLDGN